VNPDAGSAPGSDPAALLGRTRSTVANVLIASALGIAASGVLLRNRDRFPVVRVGANGRHGLTSGLVALAVASYVVHRTSTRRGPTRFYRRHVAAAALAALAVPLGLAHGWLVRPALEEVGAYWVVAIGFGLLAVPRAYELEGLGDDPAS
jgi:hypothetical protein